VAHVDHGKNGVGKSESSEEASELQSDGTLLLGMGIWLASCTFGFSFWMACMLPTGIEGSCSSRLLIVLLNLGFLVLVSVIAVVCGCYISKWMFEGFIACIRHKFFAQVEEWLDQTDPTWSWPTRLTLRRQLLPELRKDPKYIAFKRRRQRQAVICLLSLAFLAGMSIVYTHFHFFRFLVLKQWQVFSETDDPYQVLGVQSNASLAEVEKAYRRISLKCYPERFDFRSMQHHDCLLLMPRAHSAWTILSNNTLKVAWDLLPRKSFTKFLQP
jgi:hypothetical protein